jgi:hypothetical protein
MLFSLMLGELSKLTVPATHFPQARETDPEEGFACLPETEDPIRPVSFDNSEQSVEVVRSVQLGRRIRAEHPQLTDGEVRTPLLRLFFGSSQSCHAIAFNGEPGKLPCSLVNDE